MKKIKFVYIYFIFIFLALIGFISGSSSKNNIFLFKESIDYFGITLIPIFLFLILYGLIFFKEPSLKRIVLEVKLYLFLIFMFFLIYTLLLWKAGINAKNIFTFEFDENFIKNILDLSIYKYKIGYFPSFILYKILSLKTKASNIILGIGIVDIVLLFLIIFNSTKIFIFSRIETFKENSRLKKEEKLIQEQIKIKEFLQKNETEKIKKFNKLKEKKLFENKEKIKYFKNESTLKKIINIDEDNRDN